MEGNKEGEKWKGIFSRKNVVLRLVPACGVILVLLAAIILLALSALNRMAEILLITMVFVFVVWLSFSDCFFALRGKSGKKKVVGIVIIAVIYILVVCCLALYVWNWSIYDRIEHLQAMQGSAEWTVAAEEELNRAESLYETMGGAAPIFFVIVVFTSLFKTVFFRTWQSEDAENPLPKKEIDQDNYLK